MSIEYRDKLEAFLTDSANSVFKRQRIVVDIWDRVPLERKYYAKYWWERGAGEITFMFPSQETMEKIAKEELLAALAHELGHAEQRVSIRKRRPIPPPLEVDAWARGIKYAKALGVLEQYYTLFVSLMIVPPDILLKMRVTESISDIERVRTQIRELLGS